jgi:hypothetical protein
MIEHPTKSNLKNPKKVDFQILDGLLDWIELKKSNPIQKSNKNKKIAILDF